MGLLAPKNAMRRTIRPRAGGASSSTSRATRLPKSALALASPWATRMAFMAARCRWGWPALCSSGQRSMRRRDLAKASKMEESHQPFMRGDEQGFVGSEELLHVPLDPPVGGRGEEQPVLGGPGRDGHLGGE